MGVTEFRSPEQVQDVGSSITWAMNIICLRSTSKDPDKMEVVCVVERPTWMHINSAFAEGSQLEFKSYGSRVRELVGNHTCRESFAVVFDRDDLVGRDSPIVIGFRGSNGSLNITIPVHAVQGFARYLDQS